jgi:hypothetical protein
MNLSQLASSLFLVVAAVVGCGGGHGSLAANSAKFPISMSRGVRAPDGGLLGQSDMVEVGKLKTDFHAWSMLWNMIPLSGERDISEEVNQQVQAAGGEAVVGLGVTSSNCTWSFFTIIGFLPDCAAVDVEGTIVKRKRATEAAPNGTKQVNGASPENPADSVPSRAAAPAVTPIDTAEARPVDTSAPSAPSQTDSPASASSNTTNGKNASSP